MAVGCLRGPAAENFEESRGAELFRFDKPFFRFSLAMIAIGSVVLLVAGPAWIGALGVLSLVPLALLGRWEERREQE